MQPLRVAWFNAKGSATLKVDYQGPDLPRQKIPAQVLWRGAEKVGPGESPSELRPGLYFAALEGNGWYSLPDFSRLAPVRTGAATHFDVQLRTRPEASGLLV